MYNSLSVTFDIMCKLVTIDKHTCHSDKVRFVWDNATDTDVAHYKKSILCAKLTTCEKKKLFKTLSKSIYNPVNFIGPDSVTDTDLRLNCRIPVSNCKQNLHYARDSDLKLCAMWHLKINGNAVDIIPHRK